MFTYNQMYYFRYYPKNFGRLPIFDQLPLMLPLLIMGQTMIGLNMHWIPGQLRVKFLQATLTLYQQMPENAKHSFHLWYRNIKYNPALSFATCAVRKYYLSHCSAVQIIPAENWGDLPMYWNTQYRPRYLKKLY